MTIKLFAYKLLFGGERTLKSMQTNVDNWLLTLSVINGYCEKNGGTKIGQASTVRKQNSPEAQDYPLCTLLSLKRFSHFEMRAI